MTPIESAIFNEILKTIEILGGQSDLLCILGSFQDSLSDEEVLAELKIWNRVHTTSDNKSDP